MSERDLSTQIEAVSARLARIEKILGLQNLPSTGSEIGEGEEAGEYSGQSNHCHGNSHASIGCGGHVDEELLTR